MRLCNVAKDEVMYLGPQALTRSEYEAYKQLLSRIQARGGRYLVFHLPPFLVWMDSRFPFVHWMKLSPRFVNWRA